MIPATTPADGDGHDGLSLYWDTGGSFDDNPVWVDLTDYLLTVGDGEPVRVTWGRQDWQGDTSPATCTFVLDNRSGAFSPGSGVYQRGARVWVRWGQQNAWLNYPVFDGYVDSITESWAGGVLPVVQVEATDVLGRMASVTLDSMVWEEARRSGQWFTPLDRQMLAPIVSGGVQAGPFTVVPSKYGTAGASISLDDDGVTFTGAGSTGYRLQAPAVAAALDVTVWVNLDTPPGSNGVVWEQRDRFGNRFALEVTPQGYAQLVFLGVSVTSLVPVVDAGWTQVRGRVSGGFVYVSVNNGAEVSASTSPLTGFSAVTVCVGGAADSTKHLAGQVRWLGAFNSWPAAGGFVGEDFVSRVNRLVNYRMPGKSRLTGSVGVPVGSQDTTGVTLQQAVFDAARAARQTVWAHTSGGLEAASYLNIYDPTAAPAVTVDAASHMVGGDLQVVSDGYGYANRVTVTPQVGVPVTVDDPAGQVAVGVAALDVDAPTTSGTTADLAGWLLSLAEGQDPRVPQVTVTPPTLTSDQTSVDILGVTPGGVVELTNLQGAFSSTMDLVVEGGVTTLSVDGVSVTWNTSRRQPLIFHLDGAGGSVMNDSRFVLA